VTKHTERENTDDENNEVDTNWKTWEGETKTQMLQNIYEVMKDFDIYGV
jgi:hypothetical protein